MYNSWMEAGCTPTACPSSQISQRAESRSSWSPKTARQARVSIAGEARAPSLLTVTSPSRTLTAEPKRVCGTVRVVEETWAENVKVSGPCRGCKASTTRVRSDGEACIRFREHVPFPSSFLGVRPAEHCIGELLPQLDAWLIERIDPVELTSIDRRDLEEHEQLTEM